MLWNLGHIHDPGLGTTDGIQIEVAVEVTIAIILMTVTVIQVTVVIRTVTRTIAEAGVEVVVEAKVTLLVQNVKIPNSSLLQKQEEKHLLLQS